MFLVYLVLPIRIYYDRAFLAACIASIGSFECLDICDAQYVCLLWCSIDIGMLVSVAILVCSSDLTRIASK